MDRRRGGADRRDLRRRRVAVGIGAFDLCVVAVTLPLGVLAHQISALGFLVPCVPFAAVGCFVAVKQQRNPVGWLLLALGTGSLVGLAASDYSLARFRAGYGGLPLGQAAAFLAPLEWVSVLLLLPLPLLLFPEGKLPGLWRWLMHAYVVAAGVWFAVVIGLDIDGLIRPLRVDSSGSFRVVDYPPTGWETTATNAVVVLVYVVLAFAAVARQLLAFRGSSGERRQQLKWLLGGGAVCFIGLLAALWSGSKPTGVLAIVAHVGLLAVAALPLGLGVGILKYRLYEIDRVISRTLSYALLSASLGGLFVGIIVITTDVLPFSSTLGIAASTLTAAALFNPLRRRTQRLIDTRFNRSRYDAERAIAGFTARLRHAVDVDSVTLDLLDTVNRTLSPAHASVWISSSAQEASALPGGPPG